MSLESPQEVNSEKVEEKPPSEKELTAEQEEGEERTCCCNVQKRYLVVILLSVGMFIAHAMRVNLAVTVIEIVDKNAHATVKAPSSSIPHIHWKPEIIGVLHSVFYMGYLVTQIPGGYLTTILPSHRLFGAVILCSGALNNLLPVTIHRDSFGLTCLIRVIQGLFEGMLFPSCYAVMRHWTIPDERSRMGAIVLAGVYLGPMVGLTVSGVVTHYVGWQYPYFIHGGGCVVWFVVWFFLSYETPAEHPHITKTELVLMEKAQGETAVKHKHDKIPWMAIFTSMPVNAINVCNFARNWVFYLMLTNEPLYIDMFGYSIAENGVYSALPHALMAIVAILSGPLADLLVRDIMLTRTDVRKMFTGIGFGMEAACMLILGFTVSGFPALTYLTIGIGVSGLTVSGWQISHLDLAPRYAGILVAISTTVGTIAGISIPIITGVITTDMSIRSWQDVYLLTAGILLFAVIFYTIFGSAETQPWAEPRPDIQLINVPGPLDSGKKPYGTFKSQVDYFDKPDKKDGEMDTKEEDDEITDDIQPEDAKLIEDQKTEGKNIDEK